MPRFLPTFAIVLLTLLPATCVAQGLIYNLPEPGSYVIYEGDVTQVEARPNTPEGSEELKWIRRMTITAFGTERATYRGREEDCQWIEIEVTTGVRTETGPERGLVGARVYKVLVPKSAVVGTPRDSRGVHVSMLPIVKGYKRLGQGETKAIRAGALRIYPSISMLAHYRDPQNAGANDPGVAFGAIQATKYLGSVNMERRTSRTTNSAEYWISKDVPFGLARWKVNVTRDVKGQTDDRAAFKQVSRLTIEMKAQEKGVDPDRQPQIDQK